MALNRTAVRTDIGYLSRRRKAVVEPEPTQPPVRTTAPLSGAGPIPSTGLTLGVGPSTASPSRRTVVAGGASPAGLTLADPAAERPGRTTVAATTRPRPAPSASERLFPAPGFGSLRELDEENPVVRLNPRQSAIGSLLVPGVRSAAWEDEQLSAGAHHSDGMTAGTAVVTPGNRPLVGIQDGTGIVSLRHVRLLRRALFVAGERPLTVGVFDGAAAAVAARSETGKRSVLYVARIGSVLELRAEFVPADAPDAAIWAMFGVTMTIPLDQRVLSR